MMQNKKKFNTEIVNTVIGEESSIKGAIHSQRSIRIEGSLEGEINSQGEVYISEKSQVKANIFGRNVIVAGEVVGNIEAIKSLTIRKTGKVYGNITGDKLTIEEGGIYKGKVNMDVISAKNPYEGDIALNTKA
jgi:cytoskeletal protein CcmA (bactofilin family)